MSNGSDILFFAFMLINVSLILVKTVPSARTTAATEDTNALARLATQDPTVKLVYLFSLKFK